MTIQTVRWKRSTPIVNQNSTTMRRRRKVCRLRSKNKNRPNDMRGRSGSGSGSGSTRPRPIRGGRPTSSTSSVGRGLRPSPEVSPLYFSSSQSTIDSVMGGRGVPVSPTYPQQEAEQHTASPQSQVGEASSSNTPAWGTVDLATGKLWIRPVGTTEFQPRKTVKSFMGEQMFRNFNQPWASWTKIPQDHRDAWFTEFLRQFSWLPNDWDDLRKAYNFRGSKWLSDRFYKLRNERGKKKWIQPEVAEQLFQRWVTDEKFIKQSEQNKLNRAHMDGPSYAGGCIPFSEHRRKIIESGDVPPELITWTTFERTHSQKIEGGGKRWINARSQQFADNYHQLTQERDSQIENGPSSSYSNNNSLFIQAAGGINKKGRVFGMGASASELKSSMKRTSSTVGGVPAEDKRVKVLEEKVKEQGEMLTQMRELIRSLLKEKGT